jgi:uncharacterized membrane protein
VIKTLRKLVLGETWTLPIGVAVAVGVAAVLRGLAGDGWWRDAGGFVLLALILLALLAAVGRPGRR